MKRPPPPPPLSCCNMEILTSNVWKPLQHGQVVQSDALTLLSDLCNWSLVDERAPSEDELATDVSDQETRSLESKVWVWCGAVRCGAVRFGSVRCGAVRLGIYGLIRSSSGNPCTNSLYTSHLPCPRRYVQ